MAGARPSRTMATRQGTSGSKALSIISPLMLDSRESFCNRVAAHVDRRWQHVGRQSDMRLEEVTKGLDTHGMVLLCYEGVSRAALLSSPCLWWLCGSITDPCEKQGLGAEY